MNYLLRFNGQPEHVKFSACILASKLSRQGIDLVDYLPVIAKMIQSTVELTPPSCANDFDGVAIFTYVGGE